MILIRALTVAGRFRCCRWAAFSSNPALITAEVTRVRHTASICPLQGSEHDVKQRQRETGSLMMILIHLWPVLFWSGVTMLLLMMLVVISGRSCSKEISLTLIHSLAMIMHAKTWIHTNMCKHSKSTYTMTHAVVLLLDLHLQV